jgi:hypothetical protein
LVIKVEFYGEKMDEIEVREYFEKLLNGFDFEKVESIMKFLNWEYYFGDVPNIEQMKNLCRDLLNSCIFSYNNPKWEFKHQISWKSGGFKVTLFEFGEIQLDFIPVTKYVYSGLVTD